MKVFGRLFGLLLLAWFGTIAVAASMALQRKREVGLTEVDESADEIALTAIFESVDVKSTATSFRGGTLECWFGGGSLDLREATLDPSGATLRVTAIFGGGQILVPPTWSVETRVVGVGGVGDARGAAGTEAPAADAPTLTLAGTVVFGGFGVMSPAPRPAARPTPVAV